MKVNVIYAPLGGNMGDPLDVNNNESSLETLRSKDNFITALKNEIEQYGENEDYSTLISKLESFKSKDLIIWGTTLIDDINEDDIIFFGYRNCLLYVGKAYRKVNQLSNLNYWGKSSQWPNKIIMKSLIKIYIPRNKQAYERSLDMRNVLGITSRNIDFSSPYKSIFNINHKGGMQGSQFLSYRETDNRKNNKYESQVILDNFRSYIFKNNFNNIIKDLYSLEKENSKGEYNDSCNCL